MDEAYISTNLDLAPVVQKRSGATFVFDGSADLQGTPQVASIPLATPNHRHPPQQRSREWSAPGACAKVGKEPQKSYSGRVMFRVDPEVHRKAAFAAELSGKSLNQWVEEVLNRAAHDGQAAELAPISTGHLGLTKEA